MQNQEFDKLLVGEKANWAKAFQPSAPNLPKEEIIQQIKEQETEIPEEKRAEIQTFINLLIGLKVKEREIRRRVKARFNITVV